MTPPISNRSATPRVSFEFFPPAAEEARTQLLDTARSLASFQPSFVSVTYGAGGTSQDRTLRALADLTASLEVPVAGHLTTVNATATAVHETLDAYLSLGVEHVVALRGDPPAPPTNGSPDGSDPGIGTTGPANDFASAIDLVHAIRARSDGARFQISVAAYPEVHPRAVSAQADLDHLKAKIDAGADRAITQFFFDTDVFLRFVDRARAAGITAPIVPGIMPVASFAGLRRFAQRCGANIPGWMEDLLVDLDDDPDVSQLVAATIATEQCRRLSEAGVDDFHFYTMNRRQLTAATCRTLGLGRSGTNNSATEGATEDTTGSATEGTTDSATDGTTGSTTNGTTADDRHLATGTPTR